METARLKKAQLPPRKSSKSKLGISACRMAMRDFSAGQFAHITIVVRAVTHIVLNGG
jgi:hypothetical protein